MIKSIYLCYYAIFKRISLSYSIRQFYVSIILLKSKFTETVMCVIFYSKFLFSIHNITITGEERNISGYRSNHGDLNANFRRIADRQVGSLTPSHRVCSLFSPSLVRRSPPLHLAPFEPSRHAMRIVNSQMRNRIQCKTGTHGWSRVAPDGWLMRPSTPRSHKTTNRVTARPRPATGASL